MKWSELFKSTTLSGLVIGVYDGDTFTLRTSDIKVTFKGQPLDDTPIDIKCRMVGYDSEEMKGGSDERKYRAAKAQARLVTLMMDKAVRCEVTGLEKYGRFLVRAYIADPEHGFETCINDVMLEEGHVKAPVVI